MNEQFIKNQLFERLPKIVWIGLNPSQSQKAFLVVKDGILEYEMTNGLLEEAPKGVLYFRDYSTFAEWISKINRLHQSYMEMITASNNIVQISEIINSAFEGIEQYTPHINLSDGNIGDIGNIQSISIGIESVINTLRSKLIPEIKRLTNYLMFNKFLTHGVLLTDNGCINDVIENIAKFDEKYENEYLPILQRNYFPKMYNPEDSYSVLTLANRTCTPFIAAKKFLLHKNEEQTTERMRNAMRNRWNNFDGM